MKLRSGATCVWRRALNALNCGRRYSERMTHVVVQSIIVHIDQVYAISGDAGIRLAIIEIQIEPSSFVVDDRIISFAIRIEVRKMTKSPIDADLLSISKFNVSQWDFER